MPLAAYDEFYEAMGLDEAETRLVETPWFLGDGASLGTADLADADEEEDEEATRVMEALSESVPGQQNAPDHEPRAAEDWSRHAADTWPPPQHQPDAPTEAAAPADLPAIIVAGAPAPHRPRGNAYTPATGEAGEPPGAALYDADDDDSSSAVARGLRPPRPAAGRPAPPRTSDAPPAASGRGPHRLSDPGARAGAGGGPISAHGPHAGASAPRRTSFRPRSVAPARAPLDQADERTAPALRYIRQINNRRTVMLVVLSIALFLALVANVILLMDR
jgi:hypothetical protein